MTTYQDRSARGIGQWRTVGDPLIYRLEGELRGAAEPTISPESVCFAHDLEARVVGGPLSGHHLTGLSQLTLRANGVGVLAGPGTIECEGGAVSLEVRGYVIPPSDVGWPRREVISARAYDFPDHDYRVTGSALMRSSHPSYAHLDGTTATVDGWINYESGEVEMEARAM